jgi:4-carboxymuconolactone decarboxylase
MVYESILQSYLFLGYPRCIEGLKLLKTAYPRFVPSSAGVSDGRSLSEWRKRGERLCQKIYGTTYGPLRSRISEISPDLDQWMVWEGYGKVLSRDGLPPLLRELCTCSALIVTGDMTQLHSHMRGALNSGGSPKVLVGMLRVLEGSVPKQRLGSARILVRNVCSKVGADAKKV